MLAELASLDAGEERLGADVDATRGLLERTNAPFDETSQSEHLTASGFVVSERGIVLQRHLRLGIWVQPGGHVDGAESPHAAVLREVLEETGLTASHLDPPLLVDVNVHPGPRGHRHFDCRWLLVAAPVAITPGPGESTDVGWYLPEAALARCEPGLRAGLARGFAAARDRKLAAVASWPL